MSAKPLPPGRPPGSLDLLEPESSASPRDGESADEWRADALGRSRHSRLASEVREPLDDTDPKRAERLCAEVTRDTLGDLAPALLLLSAARRRRLQALTAWSIALFDFAIRPGLAGLDGDRLAQINLWEYRTEEALDGNPPGQPVFVMMAREESIQAWPREALDEIGSLARRAQTPRDLDRTVDLGRMLATALLGPEPANTRVAAALAPLVGVAIESAGPPLTDAHRQARLELLESVRTADAPPGWRRAARYAHRVLRARLRRGSVDAGLGLASRLRFLALSVFR